MTIDEAIYCLKSYLPDNEVNMCQKCKYYGFANENESESLVLTCQSHMAHSLAIKALEEQQWIPCSKRLPEEDLWLGGSGKQFSENVMVTIVNRSDEDTWVDMSHTVDGEWMLELPRHCKTIAWMPMPEPYKGSSND